MLAIRSFSIWKVNVPAPGSARAGWAIGATASTRGNTQNSTGFTDVDLSTLIAEPVAHDRIDLRLGHARLDAWVVERFDQSERPERFAFVVLRRPQRYAQGPGGPIGQAERETSASA